MPRLRCVAGFGGGTCSKGMGTELAERRSVLNCHRVLVVISPNPFEEREPKEVRGRVQGHCSPKASR